MALAEEAEPNLRKERTEWFDRLEREHDNLRAALDYLEASGKTEPFLRMSAAVWRFWSLRGHLAEGLRRLEGALGGDLRPTGVRANALNGAADLALDLGDAVAARARAEEALALHRALDHVWGAAESLLLLGLALAFRSDWSTAQQRFDESARLFGDLGDEHNALSATRRLAWTHEELGDLERAQALHEDNLRRARATHADLIEAESLGVLAQYALNEGRIGEAVPMLTEAHRASTASTAISRIASGMWSRSAASPAPSPWRDERRPPPGSSPARRLCSRRSASAWKRGSPG